MDSEERDYKIEQLTIELYDTNLALHEIRQGGFEDTMPYTYRTVVNRLSQIISELENLDENLGKG